MNQHIRNEIEQMKYTTTIFVHITCILFLLTSPLFASQGQKDPLEENGVAGEAENEVEGDTRTNESSMLDTDAEPAKPTVKPTSNMFSMADPVEIVGVIVNKSFPSQAENGIIEKYPTEIKAGVLAAQNACSAYVTHKYNSLKKDYPDNRKKRSEFFIDSQIRTLRFHEYSTYIIFIIVHFLVLYGLYASMKEFNAALVMRSELAKRPVASSDGESVPEHELRIGLEGLAVKTSYVGLVILCTSFAFYFLYIKYVYPITVVTITG